MMLAPAVSLLPLPCQTCPLRLLRGSCAVPGFAALRKTATRIEQMMQVHSSWFFFFFQKRAFMWLHWLTCMQGTAQVSDKDYLKLLEKLLYYFFSSHGAVCSDLGFWSEGWGEDGCLKEEQQNHRIRHDSAKHQRAVSWTWKGLRNPEKWCSHSWWCHRVLK